MSGNESSWDLVFCAGYVVYPCKEKEIVREEVIGSSIKLGKKLINFFYPLFEESEYSYKLGINFKSEDGLRENHIRDLVRKLAIEDYKEKVNASHELAYKLSKVTTNRSPMGLFVTLVGKRDNLIRVLLWKFPAHDSLQAISNGEVFKLDLIEDVFSKEEKYFKAAVFEGTSAENDFWRGKVEDRQANWSQKEVAKFWISDFLYAVDEITPARGTEILTSIVSDLIRKTDNSEDEDYLISSIKVLKSQGSRRITFRDFANNYLTENLGKAFLTNKKVRNLLDSSFNLDQSVIEKKIKLKQLDIDGKFAIRGPFDEFDKRVIVKETDEKDIVEVSISGRITSKSLRAK